MPFAQRWPVGTKISKCFDGGEYYAGVVERFDAKAGYYDIKYDDDDAEEFDEDDMEKWVVKAKPKAKSKSIPVPDVVSATSSSPSSSDNDGSPAMITPTDSSADAGPGRGRRCRKVVSYKEEDDDELFDDSSVEKPPKKKGRNGSRSGRKQSKQADDDEFSFEDVGESEDEDMEDYEEEDEDMDQYEDDDDYAETSKVRRRSKGRAKSKAKSKAKGKAKKSGTGKSMAESFKPMDTPVYWMKSLEEIRKNHEYLDPCGMEATDDVIDHLVGEQVLKIGTLLQQALKSDPTTLGSTESPLNLGTACSGTDAPALAMTIVQEQMERFQFPTQLIFNHKFSCEKEPFKQSYLARNFDSVLYPDVVKMTDDCPRDVYGRITPIPPTNFFVAGTSCKNFSLLHSTKRLDIEDKGCSGETFLASVELLFKEQPNFCIFENVIGAPWEKMSEYITGRVNLATVYDTKKAIQSTQAKDTKVKQLAFALQPDKSICVVSVPMQVGVRCGATVRGFTKSTASKVLPIKWPLAAKKECSLEDLIKANKMDGTSDVLVFDTPCTYCTCTQKVDTKDYGLPQTRNRTYMFVWKPDDPSDHSDNLGIYWQALIQFLKSPVKHSLEAFLMDLDHDNIRVLREALHGPPGRHTKRSVFQEPDFFTSGNANVKHNVIAREKLGLERMARTNVGGGARGRKKVPPHCWLEYYDSFSQRTLDMLDILHSSAARDAETHDSNFSSFFWNISQNVSKEKHRTMVPGIAGCISPGGEFLCSNLGRPLLGCEKLLVQGIPYFRLALGSETEVELGDLAGNAMSLTVVSATMLAAIACRHLRSQCPNATDVGKILKYLEKSAGTKLDKSVMVPTSPPTFTKLTNAVPIFESFAALASEAVKSSVFCTCETSGRNSKSTDFLHCRICRVACCSSCLGSHAGYQMESHSVEEMKLEDQEHNMGNFISKLRNVAPSSLYFGKDGMVSLAGVNKSDVHRVGDLWKFVFNLQKVRRQRRKWVIHYNARDNNGVGEVVAEFRISIGELWTQCLDGGGEVQLGMKGELISYFPAKTAPLVPGKLEPCAVVSVLHNAPGSSDCEWMARAESTSVRAEVVGKDAAPSFRVELGLTDRAEENLKIASQGAQHKHFLAAKSRGEVGRWLYPKNWKEWPDTISITSDDFEMINGVYQRARCRQTTNQSALWIRRESKKTPALYLLIKPNVGRTGPDTAIISTSISHDDFSAIVAMFSSRWQPSYALDKATFSQEFQKANWVSASWIQCSSPSSSITVRAEQTAPSFLVVDGLSESQINMLYPFPAKSDGGISIKMNMHSGVEAQKSIRAFNYLAVPPIMRYVAQSEKLSHSLSSRADWNQLKRKPEDPAFGYCDKIIPNRPVETWHYDGEREVWARRSSPEASRRYYKELHEAPTPWAFDLNKLLRSLVIKCYPEVAAHYAARFLLDGRGDNNGTELKYRLSDAAQQSDPEYSPFKVFPCGKGVKCSNIKLDAPYVLYERQQKVVTKMSMIERGEVEYEEIEMSEHEMPGSTGISLIAKASRQRKISGGVIADAIGAGKTVISIALILQGLEAARASRSFPRQSGATLVVVPSSLVQQWESEIEKFASELKVLCVNDTKGLKKISVQQIVEADVVVAPVDIIESPQYTENLTIKGGRGKDTVEIPALPKQMGHLEKPGAKGVWIPATSRDPYGIGAANEMKNQKLRDVSAYFTYSYLDNVQRLRQKNFKKTDKGVPLEYFEWERIVVDEIHDCLLTEKDSLLLTFAEKNRRASREILGITKKDIHQRPLVYRKSIFGLTGTPLLDNSDRVIELANLIGCTYIIGLASHWRKLERESRRDIFLQHFLEPKQSREIRKAIYSKCQEYLEVACCRNTTEKELEGIEKIEHTVQVRMTSEEKELYIQSQHGIDRNKRGLGVRPENFDPSAGHDVSKFVKQNAYLPSRGKALVDTCQTILSKDPTTKIVVFTDGRIGIDAGIAARQFLEESGLGCTCLDFAEDVESQNKKIAFYQRADVTEEDRKRPRVLLLHFEHAAGLNLQKECYNLILFNPLYVGDGGVNSDPVSDASTEQQAIGRVFRPGQLHKDVHVHRLEVLGPEGEECLDGYLIRRNTDEQTLAATTNAGEA